MIPEVLLIVIVTSLSCALIGNYLVLKKLSLLGDAMSHAVLPGIIIAYFMAGQTLDSPLFFIIAVLFCIMMASMIEFISTRSIIREEAAIGVVFTALFALGVILLVQFADNVHLDQDAVLFGQVELAQFERIYINDNDIGPRSLWVMGGVFVLLFAVITTFYKELKVSTFDPAFSNSIGFSSRFIHYIIVLLTSITVIAAFEAAGTILVLALLIVPAATAYICSENLLSVLILSLIFALLSSILGYLLALQLDGSIAGSVAAVSGGVLILIAIAQKIWTSFFQQKKILQVNGKK